MIEHAESMLVEGLRCAEVVGGAIKFLNLNNKPLLLVTSTSHVRNTNIVAFFLQRIKREYRSMWGLEYSEREHFNLLVLVPFTISACTSK